VNGRLESATDEARSNGLVVFIAFAVFLVLDHALHDSAVFYTASYLSRCLRYARGAAGTPVGQLPFFVIFVPGE